MGCRPVVRGAQLRLPRAAHLGIKGSHPESPTRLARLFDEVDGSMTIFGRQGQRSAGDVQVELHQSVADQRAVRFERVHPPLPRRARQEAIALAQLVAESVPRSGVLQLVGKSADAGPKVVDEEVDLSKDRDLLAVLSDPYLLRAVVVAVDLIVHATFSSVTRPTRRGRIDSLPDAGPPGSRACRNRSLRCGWPVRSEDRPAPDPLCG